MEYENIGKLLVAVEAGGDTAPSKDVGESEMERLGFYVVFKVDEEFTISPDTSGMDEMRPWEHSGYYINAASVVKPGAYAARYVDGEEMVEVFSKEGQSKSNLGYIEPKELASLWTNMHGSKLLLYPVFGTFGDFEFFDDE